MIATNAAFMLQIHELAPREFKKFTFGSKDCQKSFLQYSQCFDDNLCFNCAANSAHTQPIFKYASTAIYLHVHAIFVETFRLLESVGGGGGESYLCVCVGGWGQMVYVFRS